MDSAALLDILGNENRRRILRLLSHKPCYVTEISDYLGVSPKAVIDHLRKLEEAGLVESRTDDQRRKYFHISRNLRLEVDVSPYEFGMKSAYPASASLDVSACRYLSLEVETDGNGDEVIVNEQGACEETATASDGALDDENVDEIAVLAEQLNCLEELKGELSLAQRWVHGRITDVLDSLSEAVDGDDEGHLRAEILAALAAGAETISEVSEEVRAPDHVVERQLSGMADQGVVERDGDRWALSA
ncbi:metalloregulator ArsR/SmtB family transcription factor [Halomicrococcus sp. NG-SE-24]|uniref:ArsR/SmtB family transcription factor n=1 Tax=Halomicrococcus sp. NG-SE-24 TaxID=3436928 RepID=UPI003D970F0D